MNVLLLGTYELGRQPFGLASAAAWLRRAKAVVTCIDLSRADLNPQAVRDAEMVAFYVPMHTATRIAATVVPRVRDINAAAHLCFFGLYAPVNDVYLRELGAASIIGGEFEQPLVDLVERLGRGDDAAVRTVSLAKQKFLVPQRDGLPPLSDYSALQRLGRPPAVVGYTEASRGCLYECRHCPVVAVYGGIFRIVQRDVVLEDIRHQVEAGAEHITFGDPDFFNGVGHATRLVRALHTEMPDITYDVTIKVEHLLRHAKHLPLLRDTGCLFVTSAVESLDDAVLDRIEKGHSRADFFEAVQLMRDVGLTLAPTFIPFTPWTKLEDIQELLRCIAELDLIDNVSPIQLALRLLIPAGSRLMELDEVRRLVGPFEARALSFPWKHPDPAMDALADELLTVVEKAGKQGFSRRQTFERLWARVQPATVPPLPQMAPERPSATIPYLDEPWYC